VLIVIKGKREDFFTVYLFLVEHSLELRLNKENCEQRKRSELGGLSENPRLY